MTTILITGFGRFPGAPYNPSGPLARAVARRRRPAFADVQRVVHIFETSYAAVDRDLPKLLARHKPDIVLMFGLAGRTPQVRIETRARNAKSILFPDVTGYRPDESRDRSAASQHARGHAPFARLLAAARASRSAHAAVARCRALSVQLHLLARARGVPFRYAGAVRPHSAGRARAAAARSEATGLACRARARRRGHSARASGGTSAFRLIRCPATGRRFGRAS